VPRVSIIIPAYNAAQLLPHALDSILAQTYEDWEAIVVDDASTDETAAVASGRRDPRISCVRSPRNLGIGGARNQALPHARGELVALLDADDVWLAHYLERQVAEYDAAVARGEDVGVVCCDSYHLGPDGLPDLASYEPPRWPDPITLTTLLRGNSIFVSAMVPRAVIEELGGFATDCLGTEDYDMWLRIAETGRRVVAVREPLVGYRVGDTSISKDVAIMSRAMQRTYQRALARGRLSGAQRRIAERQLRFQRLVELRQEAAAQTKARPHQLALLVRVLALATRVAIERPGLWPRSLKPLRRAGRRSPDRRRSAGASPPRSRATDAGR
jgi:glycosyltransferase involved in cell wall biosynthesis